MNRRRFRLLAAALAGVAGVVTFLVATELFPYHTVNHDEGVYLQQAAMLLEGQFRLSPPVPEAFRPWFFVADGGEFYPKYAPVPAAMFAVGTALGEPRISLALVAAGNVALATGVASGAFDRRTGLLAGVFLAASPLFVIDSAVFLPYAPTTFWNLLFAFCYLRAARLAGQSDATEVAESDADVEEHSDPDVAGQSDANARRARAYALLAGLAIGTAFFARPYTAVLFAAPFIAHALYALVAATRHDQSGTSGARAESDARAARAGVLATPVARLWSATAARLWSPIAARLWSPTAARLSLTALGGLAGVAATLAYNAAVTGSPWLFPYEAFAPEDGLGFGHREILGHVVEYTPELALRANAEVVEILFTEWVVAGPLGTLLAAVGVAAFLRRASARASGWVPRPAEWSPDLTDAQATAVLAGLFVSVSAGNVYFWGNYNLIAGLADPDDGLVVALGPYYHFDLLVPTAAFAAHGALLGFDRARAWAGERVRRAVRDRAGDRTGGRAARGTAAALALAGLLALGGATGAVLAPPVADNAETTAAYEDAYAPFEEREFSNALVFLPTPYGDWLNHPFQHLRNDPGYDGDAVYALADGPDDLDVVAAFPNRTYYRYVYRGQWIPFTGESVEPALRRVEAVEGEGVTATATLGVPDAAHRVTARLATDEGTAYYAMNGTPAELAVELRVRNGTARLAGPAVRPVGDDAAVPVDDEDEVHAEVFVSDRAGGGFSYRLELPVRTEDGTVRALSPRTEACLSPATCGGEAAYVPSALPDGIWLETDLRTNESVDGDASDS